MHTHIHTHAHGGWPRINAKETGAREREKETQEREMQRRKRLPGSQLCHFVQAVEICMHAAAWYDLGDVDAWQSPQTSPKYQLYIQGLVHTIALASWPWLDCPHRQIGSTLKRPSEEFASSSTTPDTNPQRTLQQKMTRCAYARDIPWQTSHDNLMRYQIPHDNSFQRPLV